MKQVMLVAATLLMAVVVASGLAGAPQAQLPQKTYEACTESKDKIQAQDLPRVVDQSRCPIDGRVIFDKGVKTELPEPGTGIFAEAVYLDGAQVVMVENPEGGTFTIKEAGSEESDASHGSEPPETYGAQASSSEPTGCASPTAYSHFGFRVYGTLHWRFNAPTTPAELSKDAVEVELRRAGANIGSVRDSCGISDEVRPGLQYDGRTAKGTGIGSDGTCPSRPDGISVIGFGSLPVALGRHCGTYGLGHDGGTKILSSDIKINSANFKWTTRVTSGCSNRWDIQGLVTHERGHTFGMGHTDERYAPYQTMSPEFTGPCNTLERSLGAGDANGLNRKH